MGIDNFHKWLKKTHPNCYSTNTFIAYDHIYIDLNFILHSTIYTCTDEKYFFNKLFKTLDYIIITFLPLKSLTIAIDGPSTYAKLLLQRKRRLESAYDDTKNNTKINSLHLTPGTELMMKIDLALQNYVHRVKKIIRAKSINYKILPSSEPDEGEIKIIKVIRENHAKNEFDSHFILGNDADIVVIAMAINNVNNIYVGARINKEYAIIDIDKLRNNLITKYKIKDNISLDFAFLSILMGNDYLPKLQYVTNDTIWNSYDETMAHNKKTIMNGSNAYNFDVLITFFQNIVCNIRKHYNILTIEDNFADMSDQSSIQKYIEGFLWCLHMYNTGVCSKYDYVYDKPTQSPIKILMYLNLMQIKDRIQTIKLPISTILPVKRLTYLVFVLPKKSHHILINIDGELYKKLLDTLSNCIADIDNCNTCVEIRKQLSTCHKQLIQLKKNNEDNALVRNQISITTKSSMQHKKLHAKTNINLIEIISKLESIQ